jgi:hypothetical protein
MRSEDRKPSKRVFPLLQNLDLDTVTFANVQGVGEPITLEDMNQQELQDLVLVNLARLVVSGEWTGLLEAGGGGGYNVPSVAIGASSEFDLFNIAMQWEGGGSTVTTLTLAGSVMYFCPFIAPVTGVPTACSIYVNTGTAQDLYVSFYSSTNGVPATMLGYATIDTTSTGAIRVTSFTEASTGSLTFTAGEKYWYGFNKSGNGTPVLISLKDDYGSSVCNNETATGNNSMDIAIRTVSASVESAPVDVATTEIEGSGSGGNRRMLVWLEF